MGAVNTPTGNQMIRNSGKARNYHALHWLAEPLQAYNRMFFPILSFHPISPGTVANATWRLSALSRMLSPCFLTGAPLRHGRMRLTQPRGFRALRHWVWLFHFVSLLFVHSIIRYVFHLTFFKELDPYILLMHQNKLKHYCFPVTILLSTETRDSSALWAAKVVFTLWKKTKWKLVISSP